MYRGIIIMGVKKKLGIGVASAAIGLSLLAGGTYSYFSDEVTSNNTFAAGTLDLSVEPTEIVNLENMAPGDTVEEVFELQNLGTLDIEKVLLETNYSITDVEGNNTEDFGKHINVEFLYNVDQVNEVIYQTSLYDLKSMTPEAVSDEVFSPLLGEDGLEAGTSDDLIVKFEFVDNGKDQNRFQGDSLNLAWTFNALQGDGEEK